jgi:putative ABC transport system substrate-binding protein
MKRRDIFGLVVGGASTMLSVCLAKHGRASGRKARIGVLLPVPGNEQFIPALQQGLRDAGLDVDRDVELEIRRADGTIESFRRLGTELAGSSVDVLVTASTTATTVLTQVTNNIPIVFVGTFDPVAAGLVESLEHPGRSATGIAGFQADIAEKWVSHLKEMAPAIERMVIFYNPASIPPAALSGWKAVAEQKIDLSEIKLDTVADIAPAISKVSTDPRAGMIVVPHTFPFANRKAVVEAMAEHGVPAIYGIAEMVRIGGLISYGQDLAAQWRMSAWYIDRIIGGAHPAELPVRYASIYALAINKRAAAALGLAVPTDLLERANGVIA